MRSAADGAAALFWKCDWFCIICVEPTHFPYLQKVGIKTFPRWGIQRSRQKKCRNGTRTTSLKFKATLILIIEFLSLITILQCANLSCPSDKCVNINFFHQKWSAWILPLFFKIKHDLSAFISISISLLQQSYRTIIILHTTYYILLIWVPKNL